ncbi:MAG: hypothetical protein Q4A92_11125 [Corynebacterium sp.]|nr:hypothetical protein [Corynebacterium sp.]
MNHKDFDAWMQHMGLTEREAAERLGCTPATVGRMRRGVCHTTGKPVVVDRRTALACAALAAGLKPWSGRPPK